MKKILKQSFKYFSRILFSFCVFILLYFAFAYLLTIIPANSSWKEHEQGIDIYVESNGVHTDIVLPTQNDLMNWTDIINPIDFKLDSAFRYIAFGWGDKGFYLNTPQWLDLKASTAFNALFYRGCAVMHVSYKNSSPVIGKMARKLTISRGEYLKIVEYIKGSFKLDDLKETMIIEEKSYGRFDRFYEANGRYYMFKTCNCWANTALKKGGIKTAIWAPFDKCIFYHRN